MVRLWKIMFDLVLIMSVGVLLIQNSVLRFTGHYRQALQGSMVLLSLGDAVDKNRLRKNKQKNTFYKSKSLSELSKKVIVVKQLCQLG